MADIGRVKRITELMQHLRNYVVLPYDDALAWT
jgi:hypothetical protein